MTTFGDQNVSDFAAGSKALAAFASLKALTSKLDAGKETARENGVGSTAAIGPLLKDGNALVSAR